MNTQPEVRFRAVETYIKNGESLRRTSEKLGLPHMTLWRWVKWYKIGGKKNLKRKRQYRRPWNRPSKEMEESVMMLKERKPGLTLRKAQQTLETEGIKMSIRGIWSIWNRYALTARAKKSGLYPFGPFTPEAKDALLRIKQKIGEGMTREAAKIANQLPSFPNDNIITIIPDKLLSRKRQLDKLSLLFTKMPFREYYKKAKLLREIFEKEKRYYSSIFAGILGMLALSWMERTQERLKLVKKLNEKAKFLREPRVKFLLSIEEGKLKSTSLNYADTMLCLAQCKKLLRSLPSEPVYPDYVASLFTSIGDFKNAIVYCNKMAELSSFEDKYDKKIFSSKIANLYAIAGRYSESRKCLKNAEKERRGFKTLFLLSSGYCAFGQGNLKEADTCLRKALETSRKEQVANYIKSASVNLAATKAALSNTKEANTTLRKYLPLLRKSKTMRDIAEIELLSGRKIDDKQTLRFPVLRLLSLIKDSSTPGRYKRALRYAETKGLTGFFHRAIVFFPEIVVSMLEKGMNTGLPKTILRFPVFNKEVPVYNIKFLGKLFVHKNQKYIRQRLQPKDTAFLIQLALKAGEPEKEIPLEKIYNNFWKNSINPSRNLSHLLVRIKKAINLPSHLLEISWKKDTPVLINRGIHFTTDYDEYKQSLAQAKALLRAGEWGFAKREYLRAFKLFRGEPFKKMYNNWSDDKRLEILFSYETEVLTFTKELQKRGRNEESEKLLKKAKRIVPLIEE